MKNLMKKSFVALLVLTSFIYTKELVKAETKIESPTQTRIVEEVDFKQLGNNDIVYVDSHEEIEEFTNTWKNEITIYDFDRQQRIPVHYTMKYIDKSNKGLNIVKFYEMYNDKDGIERSCDVKEITFFVGNPFDLREDEIIYVNSHEDIKWLSKEWLNRNSLVINGVRYNFVFHMAYVNGYQLHGENNVKFWVTYSYDNNVFTHEAKEFTFCVK